MWHIIINKCYFLEDTMEVEELLKLIMQEQNNIREISKVNNLEAKQKVIQDDEYKKIKDNSMFPIKWSHFRIMIIELEFAVVKRV